ncbi:MAG: TonB-dependent receptor, partial [Bacteroidales bacterium]|nr:TonB-dependent receptor [Bacteroidales bacterium]
LMIEGPIKKNKSSFIVSGRRTYIDILARPLIKYQARQNDLDKFTAGYYFYDLTGKVNYKISNKSTVFLSTYMGRDKAYLGQEDERNDMMIKSDFGLFWGNITTALRWNYMINKKLFSNSTLTYSRYRFITSIYFLDKDTINTSEIGFDYKSGIYDWTGKIDFDYIPNPNHYIKFGGSLIYHTFIPGVNVFNIEMSSENETEKLDTSFGNNNIYAYENDIYIEDDFEISSRLKTNIGLHYSGFHVRNTYYQSLQPRFSGRFLIMDNWSVKLAYSQMRQYLHLLSNVTIGMPTDLWLPVTDSIKPQKSTQYAIGSAFSIKDKYEISVEGFYKDMNNLIEYKEGASFMSFDNDWEDKIEIGKGWSYGIELFFEKKLGKTSGWIGYTLSWSWRQFENISFGNRFPYKYDRRHDISIVITHEFNEKWDVGATWVYGTGNAVTLATEKYLATFKNDPGNNDYLDLENMIEYFGDRNSFRMADYHRLDIGVNYHFELGKFKAKLNGAVYNVYNRKNPFILQFEDVFLNAEGTEQKTQLMQYTLFPLIPSINFTVSL